MHRQVAILGIPIHDVTMMETLALVEQFIERGSCHQVATVNTDFLVKSVDDPELHSILCESELVLADGMPLLWAARWMGSHLRERVTGADLVPRLAQLSAEKGYRLFLLGATPVSSAAAEREILRRYPGVQIAGRLAPPVAPLDAMDHESILAEIHRARPDILLVALGNPKQEKWIARHRHRLDVPVCIGVGAALDFISGLVPRAPAWMQSSGLEWIHRLVIDPGRLGRRYAVDASQFGRHLLRQWRTNRVRQGIPGQLRCYDFGASSVVLVQGNLAGPVADELEVVSQGIFDSGRDLILDLGKVVVLGADALGALLQVQRRAVRQGRRLQLAGLAPGAARSLALARAENYFSVVASSVEALHQASPVPLRSHAF